MPTTKTTLISGDDDLLRTHTCGELRLDHVGQEATLCGWVDTYRDHSGVLFIDVRDRYGKTQVVFVHAKIARADKANPTRSSFHDIMLRPGTHLAAIYDGLTTLPANSRHRRGHQQTRPRTHRHRFAPDGLLEALEDQSLTFWIGVQWHPENLPDTPQRPPLPGLRRSRPLSAAITLPGLNLPAAMNYPAPICVTTY